MQSLTSERPAISVIIPVYNDPDHLERCLTALSRSSLADFECIVADDASTDHSPEVARRHGCRLVRMEKNGGPAAARNLAAQQAAGEILFFIDSDVCVAPDSLERVADRFAADAELDALIGSYDDSPESPDFLSQYKNLLHHFTHQRGREEASTFWSGCGAIRKDVFLAYSGFSEDYKRPAIEDIELGYRMKADGRKILLDKDLRVKHLKAWTFWRLVKTDIFDRGVPWTELILRDANMPADLNLQITQRISVVLVYLLVLSVTGVAIYFQGLFLVPLLVVALLLMSNYWFQGWSNVSGRRWNLISLLVSLGVTAFLAWWYDMTSLLPPLIVALVILFLQHRYLLNRPDSRSKKIYSLLAGVTTAGVALYVLSFMPLHPIVTLPMLLLIIVVFLNSQFFVFLTGRHNIFFTLAAIPFHLLYHFYNGISFTMGTLLHWRKKRGEQVKRARQAPVASK